jgi:hypothetical protein
LEEVARSWEQLVDAVCPLQVLADKFKRLSCHLQAWSQRKVVNIKEQLRFAKEILHQLEIAQDSRVLSPQEDWLRCQLKKHALGLASLERTMAQLRSRLNWLKEGDANTSYFHHHARYRKRKNFIAKVKADGRIITDQEEKKEAIWNFYNGLLGTEGQRDLTLDLEVFHRPNADLTDLEQFFTKDEIWNTIKTLPSDKDPGPDGSTGRFYKVAWQVIRVDFMAAVGRLMQGDVNKLHLLNSAYITLLPKTAEAVEVKDYHPISLIHSFARIITKAMANRLANNLSTLISPC